MISILQYYMCPKNKNKTKNKRIIVCTIIFLTQKTIAQQVHLCRLENNNQRMSETTKTVTVQ